MLYDDVINDNDYVGFKRATEDRELKSIIEDGSHKLVASMMHQMTLVVP